MLTTLHHSPKMKTLDDLFLDRLRNMYAAEKKIARALPTMSKVARSRELAEAFDNHRDETLLQIGRLEQVFDIIDKSPRPKSSIAALGIIEEGSEIAVEFKGSDAIDAGLIAAAQAVEHYEIANYGSLIAWAEELGLSEAAQLLEKTLEEEKKTDKRLTELAEGRENKKAEAARERHATDRADERRENKAAEAAREREQLRHETDRAGERRENKEAAGRNRRDI
jgi:ferritin-like metal-binding protein YciE